MAATDTVLDLAAQAILAAAIDRIHPADETGPGGVDLGALTYVTRALAGPLRRFADEYRAGLAEIDAAGGGRFAALGPEEQDAALAAVERAHPVFFGLLLEHVYEGLLGDPAHGGNAGAAGWRLVGYPGPRTVVTAEEQRLDAPAQTTSASTYESPMFRHEEGR